MMDAAAMILSPFEKILTLIFTLRSI